MTLDRLEKNLIELNRFGALDKGITRLAYTQEEMLAKQYIKNLCEQEGVDRSRRCLWQSYRPKGRALFFVAGHCLWLPH